MGYVSLLFFISGISGLVYEVVWTRMLTLTFGSTTYSATTVLASYMGGLALGSFLAGRYIDKAKNLIKIYGILELLIAFFAVLIPFALAGLVPLYKSVSSTLNPSLFAFSLIRFGISFLIFLIPTTLMGATLPVLSKALINSKQNLGERLGLLYSINTLGAVLGCFLSGFVLISMCGVKNTIYIAAFLNMIIGVAAVFLSGRIEGEAREVKEADKETKNSSYSKKTVFWAAIVFGVSGFASLGYEVIWTRNLIFVFTSSIYSFTVMLMVFLSGIALGSYVFSRIVDKEKNPILLLALIQIMIGLFSFLALHSFKLFYYIFERYIMTDISTIGLGEFSFAVLYFVALLFPSTFFMGAAFPVTGKLVAGDIKTLGKSIGNVYSLNTVGAILGAFITGFLLVPLIHGQNTLGLLIVVNSAAGISFLYIAGKNKKGKKLILVTGVLVAVLGISLFFQEDVFTSIVKLKIEKFTGPVNVIFSAEDAEAKVAVFEDNISKERTLWINGLVVAGKCLDTKLMAHIPLSMIDGPKDALVICFGVGQTFKSALAHGVKTEVVEIVPSVIKAYRKFDAEAVALSDKNGEVIINDGRNHVLLSDKLYDVIMMDPSPPIYAAGTVNLYTRDFFQLCKERLKPGGIMCLWIPKCRVAEYKLIVKSFSSVFDATIWSQFQVEGTFVMGTVEPFKIDAAVMDKNLQKPEVLADLAEYKGFKINSDVIKRHFFLKQDKIMEYTADTPLLTDDFPVIEYPLLKWRDSPFYTQDMFFPKNREDVGEIIKR